jgi:hypothetical protein
LAVPVFGAVELSPEVPVFVAQLAVLFLVLQPEVFALVSAAPEPSLEAVVLAVGPVAEVVSFVAVVSLTGRILPYGTAVNTTLGGANLYSQ